MIQYFKLGKDEYDQSSLNRNLTASLQRKQPHKDHKLFTLESETKIQ